MNVIRGVVIYVNVFWVKLVAILICNFTIIEVAYKVDKQITSFISQKIVESNIQWPYLTSNSKI